MERNEAGGFAALILIETSLATSYKSVFSDSFGFFLRSLSDRVCMSVVAWIGAETELTLSQAVASGDAFQRVLVQTGLSER